MTKLQIIAYVALFFGFAGTAVALNAEKRLGDLEYRVHTHITDERRAVSGF